ncbi:MAG: ectoine/hydroxyectoine ABC transporter permease subunit EhuC [Gallionella sp.]
MSFFAGLVVATFTGYRVFFPELLRGVGVTIQVTLGGALVAMGAALLAATAKMYGAGLFRWLAIVYIEVFRGTSALVQLFWMYFVLPYFGVTLPPLAVGIVALGLNMGAYGAEVIRGSIQSVDRGQWEVATALNLTRMQALRRIILPQAFVVMIPPWGNLFIELLKGTSLVSMIALGDLTFKAQQLNQNTLRTVEIFSIVLILYLSLSMMITALMRALERHVSKGLARGRAS